MIECTVTQLSSGTMVYSCNKSLASTIENSCFRQEAFPSNDCSHDRLHTFVPNSDSGAVVARFVWPSYFGVKACQKISVRVKSSHCHSVYLRFSIPEQIHVTGKARVNQRLFGVGLPASGHVCRGSRQEGTEQSSPEEDSDADQDASRGNDGTYSDDDSVTPLEPDWRAFRARLVAGQQAGSISGKSDTDGESPLGCVTVGPLRKIWAHPLHVPEAGCVLIATDKLDGQADFERTVILLLRVGSNKPREGPYGVILNRPSPQKINDLRLTDMALSNVFGNCHYFHGGPLESETFLLMQEGGKYKRFLLEGETKQFVEVVPGIVYIGAEGLPHAVNLVKHGGVIPDDFRYYVGYAGWGFDQLMYEISSGYWCVAACSPTVVKATSPNYLWEKVLLLMGGQYADLSRKPKSGGY